MKITLEIPDYTVDHGIRHSWERGFRIGVKVDAGAVSVSANREGLISLAKQLLTLAQDSVPVGCHLHFDEYNSLEAGSVEFIVERVAE